MKRFKQQLEGGTVTLLAWMLMGTMVIGLAGFAPMGAKAEIAPDYSNGANLNWERQSPEGAMPQYPAELPSVSAWWGRLGLAVVSVGFVLFFDETGCMGFPATLQISPVAAFPFARDLYASLGWRSMMFAGFCFNL